MKSTIKFKQQESNMNYQQQVITPEMATFYLDKNENNRRVKTGHVNTLSRAMRLGQWKLSPQPIIFAKSGRLLDGQHRLMAVVDSGLAQTFFVCLDADESVFDVLDVGKNRNYSDITGIAPREATTLKFIATITFSYGGGMGTVTNQDMHVINDLYGDIVHDVVNGCQAKQKIICAAPTFAAASYLIKSGKNSNYVTTQLNALRKNDFTCLSPCCGAFLRIVFNSISSGSSISKNDLYRYAVKALNPNYHDRKRVVKEENALIEMREFNRGIINLS